MSTYNVAITLGSHVFAISSADAPIETTITVLDNLAIRWQFAESSPRPVQPDPSSCSLGLLTRDVDNLADVDIGTPLRVVVTSAGRTVAAFAGRVAQMSCSPRKYKNPDGSDGLAMIYQLDAVDYVVDLAELLIDFVRPVEAVSTRLNAISAAIVAAGGPPLDYAPFHFWAGTHNFDAYNASQQPALDLLLDHLRQLPSPYRDVTDDAFPGLVLVTPHLTAGVLTAFDVSWPILTTTSLVWPPAVWSLIGGKLMIDPAGGALPARPGDAFAAAGALPVGLSIDGCRVELESAEWIRSKFGAVNYVSVVGPNASAIASRPGEQPVKLALETTLLYEPPVSNAVQDLADLYLPDPDVDRWAIDAVTWRPSDAELAALPFPLVPDVAAFSVNPFEAVAPPLVGPSCYYAPVVIRSVLNALNPGSDLGYLAGTLSSVQVKIAAQTVYAEVGIERQLPKQLDRGPGNPGPIGTSWDDLQADFPAVKWSDVDLRPTWYDARLAHG